MVWPARHEAAGIVCGLPPTRTRGWNLLCTCDACVVSRQPCSYARMCHADGATATEGPRSQSAFRLRRCSSQAPRDDTGFFRSARVARGEADVAATGRPRARATHASSPPRRGDADLREEAGVLDLLVAGEQEHFADDFRRLGVVFGEGEE